jgi:tetratricopeptide (TPR) repeat protein
MLRTLHRIIFAGYPEFFIFLPARINCGKLLNPYAMRGTVYGFKGDSSQAISDLNKSIELKSDYGLVYRTRGAVYEGKGNYDQAIKDLTKAIELEPDDGLAYNFRGTVYEKQGKYNKANADFQKAKVLKK